MSEKTRIIRRIDPCGCGCKGADSWHARNFERIITDVREERGTAQSYAEYNFSFPYDRVGLASAPWSDDPVIVVRWIERESSARPIGWIFAKNLRPVTDAVGAP